MLINKKNIKILISVIVLVLIASAITLYNLRFKYYEDKAFVQHLDEIATYTDFIKITKTLNRVAVDMEYGLNSSKKRLSKSIVNSELTAKQFGKASYHLGVHRGYIPPFEYARALFNDITFRSRKCNHIGCFPSKYKNINGVDIELPKSDYSYKHSTGATVMIDFVSRECKAKTHDGKNTLCANIYIDVNGKRKPNILGVDLYNATVVYVPKAYNNKNKQAFFVVPQYDYSTSVVNCFKNGTDCFAPASEYRHFPNMLKVKPTKLGEFSGVRIDRRNYFIAKNLRLLLFDRYRYVEHVGLETVKRDYHKLIGKEYKLNYAKRPWTDRCVSAVVRKVKRK